MVLRVSFSTIRMGGILNNICQQTKISNLKLLANDTYVNKTITWRYISTNKLLLTEQMKPSKTFVDKQGNLVKKKGKDSPKITVIKLDGSKISMYLKEAEKIAKLQKLELVEVGVVADKKLYKFSKSFDSESVETKEKNKIKRILINSSILDHDLIVKINIINKLLKKKNEVLIEILKKGTEGSTNMNMIAKKIREEIGSDYKVLTESSNNKCRINISLKSLDEQKSDTDKSSAENELKPKTHENNELETGKQSS